MASKAKQVKLAKPEARKQVQLQQVASGKPHFRFEKIDRNGKFAFDLSRKDFKADLFLDKMMMYSCMTWVDISKQTHDRGKSKHHYLDNVERLSKDARDRLKALDIEDMAGDLFSFAFTNMLRIVGLRLDDNFYVLWYDPNHEVYPVKR